MQKEEGGKRSWRKLIVLGVGGLLLLAGVLLFRPLLFFFFKQTHQLVFDSDLITRPSDLHQMDLLPNLRHARLVAPARPHSSQRVQDFQQRSKIKRLAVFYVDTNSFAFRGPELHREKAPGTLRIACLGDSITFGWGSDESNNYPTILRSLVSEMSSRPIEVINAGIPGLPIEQVARVLKYKVAPFSPDIIIAMKYGNLQRTTAAEDYERELRNIIDEAQKIGAHVLLGAPPVSSFDLKPQTREFVRILEAVGKQRSVPTINFVPLFREAGRGRGVRLVVLENEQQIVQYNGDKIEILLRAPLPPTPFAVSEKVYDYLDQSTVAEALFFDEGHPDAEGNRLIAETILERIAREGWLEGR